MHRPQIRLIPFSETHFPLLQKEITDSRFLMQWAGPKYSYPLSYEQFRVKLEECDQIGTINSLYSAQLADSHEIIGHIQLTVVDRKENIASIGSVLVFSEFRNRGFSKEILMNLIHLVINEKKIGELRLNVFTFNQVALHCYQSIGFRTYEQTRRSFGTENWDLLRMKITKSEYHEC